jgi:hypothetical protein
MPEDGFKRKRKKETEFYRTQILQKDELKKKSVPRGKADRRFTWFLQGML